MNKSDLRDAVAQHAELTNAQADKAIEAVLSSITSAVAGGDKVTLPGFGTFEARQRNARTGRNPQTGETINVPASKTAKISAGSKLKAIANGKEAPPS